MGPASPPLPPRLGVYVGGLAQMAHLRTPPSTPLITPDPTPDALPDCLSIRLPSASTSTFTDIRPRRTPITRGSSSPQRPSTHDYKHIPRLPHDSSHRSLSPPRYPSKRVVDQLHIPAVLERANARFKNIVVRGIMRDCRELIDFDGEEMLVEERDRDKVMEVKRREARAKLEGWEWDQRTEERRVGMGHVRRPEGLVGDATARPAARRVTERVTTDPELRIGNVEKRTAPVVRSRPAREAIEKPDGIATPTRRAWTRAKPHLRGGDAESMVGVGGDATCSNLAPETSYWSTSTEAAGCTLSTCSGIKSGATRIINISRTTPRPASLPQKLSGTTKSKESAILPTKGKRKARKSQHAVIAKHRIPALPSSAFEDAISIGAPSPVLQGASMIQSRQHRPRLDKPLPPLPGHHTASGERATSFAAFLEIDSPVASDTGDAWLEGYVVMPMARLRKCKGRSNLLVDGLVDGYLWTANPDRL